MIAVVNAKMTSAIVLPAIAPEAGASDGEIRYIVPTIADITHARTITTMEVNMTLFALVANFDFS